MKKKDKPRKAIKTSKATRRRRRTGKPSFKEMMAMRGHHRPFKQARAFVRSLKLKNYKEWLRYCQGRMKNKRPKPIDIPQNPRNTYEDTGWVGFSDWLGTSNVSYLTHTWRPYPKAWAFVRKLKLRSNREWRAYVGGKMPRKPKRPNDIPTNPNVAYSKREWKGWQNWLGTD